jgi:hypothetical protein
MCFVDILAHCHFLVYIESNPLELQERVFLRLALRECGVECGNLLPVSRPPFD